MELQPAGYRVGSVCWTRLAALSVTDPEGVFEIAELLISLALDDQPSYLPFEEVSPCLRTALAFGSYSVRTRAKSLINRLGEQGFPDYRVLLKSNDDGSA